jgi:hypothetical protein
VEPLPALYNLNIIEYGHLCITPLSVAISIEEFNSLGMIKLSITVLPQQFPLSLIEQMKPFFESRS